MYTKLNQSVKLVERKNDSGVEYIHSDDVPYTTYSVELVKANSNNVNVVKQKKTQLENFDSKLPIDEVSATSLMPSEIQACQNQLREFNLYHGSTDGNPNTEEMVKAISQFQKAYGLIETGTLNSLTINKLNRLYSDFINIYNSDAMDTVASELWLDSEERKNFAITWSFLKNEMDLNTHQIAGVMANIKAESGFSTDNAQYYSGHHNPEYVYNTGDSVGYGLLQWTTEERKTGLKNMSNYLEKLAI